MKHVSIRLRGSQRGYMLLLVLVALVAMMVSGIALVRSIDTNQLVAGNLAARNSTVHSADLAVQQAVTWIQANATNGVLYADVPANGYYAELAQDPNWEAAATWSTCTTTTGTTPCYNFNDGAGNQVSWVIHRMCTAAGAPTNPNQYCSTANSSGSSGTVDSHKNSSFDQPLAPMNFYRITVQVSGPRNTVTLSQAFVTL
jgi:type IV pilus assembly protein PilX